MFPIKKRQAIVAGAWLTAGVAGLAIFLLLHDRAFPEARIRISVGREEALEQGAQFLAERGYSVSGYRSAVQFSASSANLFLERSLSPEALHRVIEEGVVLWWWTCRWYKPEKQEQFWVRVSPDGRIVGFEHVIPEAADGMRLSSDDALRIAEEFLGNTVGRPMDAYELIREQQNQRPNRLDHSFTWKRADFEVLGARYCMAVAIAGSEPVAYHEYLRIPEEASRKMAALASRRNLLTGAAWAMQSLLVAVAAGFLLMKLRTGDLRWRFGIVMALVVAAAGAADNLNALPASWIHYDTTQTPAAYMGGQMVSLAARVFASGGYVLALALVADAMGRQAFKDRTPASLVVTRRFWKSRDCLIGALIGFSAAFVHASYGSVFYVVGKWFGVWCPPASPYTNMLSTPLPWLVPLNTGLSAGIQEELLFRLFAIALLLRFAKRRWLAVAAPAVLWAFLHTGYPQEPIYIRGIELTAVGLFYGLIFLRYGILASFVAHYTYNALVGGLALARSDTLYYQLSGVLVIGMMLVFVLPAAVRLLQGKKLFESKELVSEEPVAPLLHRGHWFDRVGRPVERAYLPLRLLSRRTALILLGVSLVLLLLVPVLSRNKAPDFAVAISRAQAMEIADQYLAGQGIAVEQYQRAAAFYESFNQDELDYVYQHVDRRTYRKLLRTRMRDDLYWYVRYFRPGQKENYGVAVSPQGAVLTHHISLSEEAPGAELTPEDARQAAEMYLATQGVDLSHYWLLDTVSQERPKRTDHRFAWEDDRGAVGEAHWQITLEVAGDRPHSLAMSLAVPEAWHLERQRTSALDVAAKAVGAVLGIGAFIWIVWLFISYFASGWLDERLGIFLIVAGMLAFVLSAVNQTAGLWIDYNTATAPLTYLASYTLDQFGHLVAFLGILAVGALLIDAIFRRFLPEIHPIRHWLGCRWRSRTVDGGLGSLNRLPLARAWGTALATGLFVACLTIAGLSAAKPVYGQWVEPFLTWIDGQLAESEERPLDVTADAPAPEVKGAYRGYCPFLDTVQSATARTALFSLLTMAGVALYRRLFHKRLRPLLIIIAAVSVVGAIIKGSNAPAAPFRTTMAVLLVLAVVIALSWLAFRWLFRDSLGAYIAAYFAVFVLADALDMLAIGSGFHRANALLCFGSLGIMAAVSAALLFLDWRQNGAQTREAGDGLAVRPSTFTNSQ